MKKLRFTFVSVLIMAITLLPFFPIHTKFNASAETPTISIISPTTITCAQNSIYCFDEHFNKIFKFDCDITPSASGVTPTASIALSGVKKLVPTNNGIVAFVTTPEPQLLLLDYELTSSTPISFSPAYPSLSQTTDISFYDSNFYILRGDGDIDKFSFLTNTTLQLSTPGTFAKETYLPNSDDTIKMFDAIENGFLLKSSTKSYKMSLSDISPQSETTQAETTLTNGETFLFASNKFALTSTGRILNTSTNETIALTAQSISGFYATDTDIYMSAKDTHQILKLNLTTKTTIDLQINPEIQPSYLSANEFISIKTTAETDLFFKPYSISATKTIPANTHLNVIATYDNFYYCLLISENKNQFLWLNSSVNTFEIIPNGTCNTTYTATRTCSVFALPTTILDESNSVLCVISASQDVTVLSSNTISNSNGELFYLAKSGDFLGFVRFNSVQSTRGTVELTTPCNAKTKRETVLYESPDGTGEILTLEKGTRISLLEDASPTKDYLLAEFQDTKGIVYTGYIFSDDVSTDGLTTLQILGFVLIGTNIALLATILIIKKNSKKWKITPPKDTI